MSQTTREFRPADDIVIEGVEYVQLERMVKGYWFIAVKGLDGRTDKFHLACPNPSKHPLRLRHEED